jgi:hypothetical protein
MGAPKGHAKWGGKGKGTENKLTTTTKELIFNAIDQQSLHFDLTMKRIREENPIEWAKIMVKLMDFVLPKKLDITTDGKVINVVPPESSNVIKIG